MKWIALATALAFAAPVVAQEMAPPPPPPPVAGQDMPMPPPPPPADAAPMAPAAPMAQAAPMTPVEPTAGGYQPAMPPMAGPAAPGTRVVFQAPPSIEQAYPAPAPLQTYPICKRGQTDKCRQRGG